MLDSCKQQRKTIGGWLVDNGMTAVLAHFGFHSWLPTEVSPPTVANGYGGATEQDNNTWANQLEV